MKLLIKIVLVLVILVVVAGVGVLMYVDSIAKAAVESGATSALGVKTTLDKASVHVFKGEFELAGLDVANPTGFQTSHFMTLANGDVSVSLPTLMDSTIELPTLNLSGIDVNLEKKEGKSNYNVILDNMKGAETGTKPPSESKKVFIIRQVKIKNVMVHVDLLPIGGDLTKTDVPIDEITLNNVGSDGSGVSMSQLSGIIMKAVFAAIISKGGALPGELAKELESQLANLGDLSKFGVEVAGQALGNITGAAGDVLKGAGDAAGDALKGDVGKAVDEGVGGLLKGAGGILGGGDKKEGEDKPK